MRLLCSCLVYKDFAIIIFMPLAIEVNFLLPLVVSCILGALIGLEREFRDKPAGISTHVLICSGAALFTLLSAIVDPSSTSRISSNILTGIGFIGAGLILKDDRGHILGLTTAASVWATAAVGMAIGYGFYLAAVIAAIIVTLAPRLPNVRKSYVETRRG